MQAVNVAENQPAAFASMEGLFDTEDGAPLVIIGQPDMEKMRLDNPIEVPRILSFLTYRRFDAEVVGLKDIPRDEWPDNVPLHYFAYHIMVGLGTLFIAVMFGAAWLLWRGKLYDSRVMLWILMLSAPFPFIANTTGWMTAELGRQPWLVYGILRTQGRLLRHRLVREHPLQPPRLHGPLPTPGSPLRSPGRSGDWATDLEAMPRLTPEDTPGVANPLGVEEVEAASVGPHTPRSLPPLTRGGNHGDPLVLYRRGDDRRLRRPGRLRPRGRRPSSLRGPNRFGAADRPSEHRPRLGRERGLAPGRRAARWSWPSLASTPRPSAASICLS